MLPARAKSLPISMVSAPEMAVPSCEEVVRLSLSMRLCLAITLLAT